MMLIIVKASTTKDTMIDSVENKNNKLKTMGDFPCLAEETKPRRPVMMNTKPPTAPSPTDQWYLKQSLLNQNFI